MKKTVSLIEKFILLAQGESVPSSRLRGDWIDRMLEEGILIKTTRGRNVSYRACDARQFLAYLAEHYDIRDLQQVRHLLQQETGIDRAALVEATGNSKFVHQRSFHGFLVNTYEPLQVSLHGNSFTLHPQEGAFTFIADYEAFSIPGDYIIIGIENAENFRLVSRQRAFFEREVGAGLHFLFVSRYPQNGDLVKWLQAIPNRYVHFGDLDLAGVHIFLSEFKHRLGQRASFLIPSDYDERIREGSHERYNVQLTPYGNMTTDDVGLQRLLDSIHRWHRGYDQEGFISAQQHCP